MGQRINVGCGQRPTRGWRNFDNSFSLRLSKIRFLPGLSLKLGLLDCAQYQFISFARDNNIEYADAARRLPLADESVDVVYSSHMLDHLDREGADRFLAEAHRVMQPGATIRIAVPDIRLQVSDYNESGDADAFIGATHLCVPHLRSLPQWLGLVFVGRRNHQWMYDGRSLSLLLEKHHFVNAAVTPVGQTRITDPGPLNLEERSGDSVYVEGDKPPLSAPQKPIG